MEGLEITGVSVIVCCYNSVSRIEPTLKHLARQCKVPHANYELIIVDNGSTDDIEFFCKKVWSEDGNPYNLKVVREPEPGLSNARIKGLKEASYGICVFCDDDNWLSDQYLKSVLSEFENNLRLGALGGNPSAVSSLPIPDWFSYKASHFAAKSMGDGVLKYPEVKTVYGAGMALRKEPFLQALNAGFQFALSDRKKKKLSSGGDLEICYLYTLMNFDLIYQPALKFKHFMEPNRLSKEYLFRLLKSNTRSAARLYPYVYLEQGLKMNRWAWAKDLYYSMRSLFVSLVIFLVKGLITQRGDVFKYRVDAFVCYQKVMALCMLSRGYQTRYRNLSAFFHSIRHTPKKSFDS